MTRILRELDDCIMAMARHGQSVWRMNESADRLMECLFLANIPNGNCGHIVASRLGCMYLHCT